MAVERRGHGLPRSGSRASAPILTGSSVSSAGRLQRRPAQVNRRCGLGPDRAEPWPAPPGCPRTCEAVGRHRPVCRRPGPPSDRSPVASRHLFQDHFELGRHARVPVAVRGLNARAVGLARLVVAAELAERVAESAPGVALVLGAGEVLAQLGHDLFPEAELFVLRGEPEAEPRVVRVAFYELPERVYAWILHERPPARSRDSVRSE